MAERLSSKQAPAKPECLLDPSIKTGLLASIEAVGQQNACA